MNWQTTRGTAIACAAVTVLAVAVAGTVAAFSQTETRTILSNVGHFAVMVLVVLLDLALIVLAGVAVIGLPLWILLTVGWFVRRRNARKGRLTRNYLTKVVRRRLAREPGGKHDPEFAQSLLWWAQQRVAYDTPDGVEMGEAYGRVLVRWCAHRDTDLRLLRNAFVLGTSPSELEEHLDGTTLLDAEVLEMLVGLRGE